MGKGGGSQRTITQTTAPSAFAEPFLQYGMQEAKDLYQSARPQYYPKSTVVGFSPETQMALSGYRSAAAAGSPMIPAVQQTVMQNLTGTNPLLQQALQPTIQAAMQPAMSAGRYGSGYAQRAVAEAVAPLVYQAQQAAIQQAPAAREFGFADLQTMAQVGAAKEAQEQAELAADIERFQFQEARPAQKLADYMTMVQGGSGALGGRSITPQFRQPAAGFFGGALSGAQMGAGISGLGAMGGGMLGGMAGLLGA